MRKTIAVCALILCFAAAATAQTDHALNKPAYPKLGSRLAAVVAAVERGTAEAAALRNLQNPESIGATVPVTVRTANQAEVLEWFRARGFRVANSLDDTLEAFVSVGGLRALNDHPSVISVREILPPEPRIVGQGLGVHNAANWHSSGLTGGGVKAGIIDGGFVGFSSLMGTELPVSVTARCYSAIGTFSSTLGSCETRTEHGTAVAEALIDVAPQVELYIANPISRLDLRQSIDWMTSQGVRVINFSSAWTWDGPGDGTSPFTDSPLTSVEAAVAGGALFVAAAGNEGRSTWSGPFIDANSNGWGEFDHSGLELNPTVLQAGQRVSVQLRWQDVWGGASRDLDVGLMNSSGTFVALSLDFQAGAPGHVPFEFFTYVVPVTGVYYIAVDRFAGAVPEWMQLQIFTSQRLEVFTELGSIGNPAESANPGVLAVGAAAWSIPHAIEPFSSKGPTPDGRVKPDIVGVDRADSLTYGPNGFAGTSQASPHVAGLAALALQVFTTATPVQVANFLKGSALPRGSQPNHIWGYGLAYLRNVLIPSAPAMALDRTTVNFGAVTSGTAVLVQTGAQTIRLSQTGVGSVTWTAESSQPWLQVSPASGTGPAVLTISVTPEGLPPVGTFTGTITLLFNGAGAVPGPINVVMHVMPTGGSAAPFGLIETPLENSTNVTGAVPFTGWGLDDVKTGGVAICRAAVAGEEAPIDPRCGGAAQIFVGDAVFIEGARPDVQAAFPTYPENHRAGWGLMVLTNMLPNQGNGTFTFFFYLRDVEGHTALLGTRTLEGNNANAVNPFGAIDTPSQGGVASGSAFLNFGWALTPQPKVIPTDGSTIVVFIDGAPVGTVDYNHFRPDIATLFPGLANSDGAIGFHVLDTTAMTDGVHTIAWGVTDNSGAADGIGSRYFTVSNGAAAATTANTSAIAPPGHALRTVRTGDEVRQLALNVAPLEGRRGFDPEAPWRLFQAHDDGRVVIRGEELDRFELQFSPGAAGFLRVGSELAPLPIGSKLDAESGVFTWHAGVGFVGTYDLVFAESEGARREVRIVVAAKGSQRGDPQIVIDTPGPQRDVGQPFTVEGWAADLDAEAGTGISTVHVWAYPLTGKPPTFLGAADYGGRRPDVAAVHGRQFEESGYGLVVHGLEPGIYDIAVFGWSAAMTDFLPARTVQVVVR